MFSKVVSKRFIAGIAAATMAVSMSASVFAATTDPNLTTYNTPYSTVVQKGTASATLMAITADEYYQATGYDAAADAAATTWQAVAGNTNAVTGISVTGRMFPGATPKFVSQATVSLNSNADVGPISILADNPAAVGGSGEMNFTVVIDGEADDRTNVNYKFYVVDANGAEQELTSLATTGATISGDDHAGTAAEPARTSYPSALDTAGDAATANTSVVFNIGDEYDSGANTLQSVTIGSDVYENYTDANYNYFGWQYRVYRNGTMVSDSNLFGAEEFALQSGDTVIWKYGQYGVVEFDATI